MVETWLLYSLIAMLGSATIHLIYKKIGSELNPKIILFYGIIIQIVLFYIILYIKKQPFILNRYIAIFILLAAILSLVGSISIIFAIKLSPNPGYYSAIGASSTVLVAILSKVFFNSEINLLKIVGIILVIIGVTLISYEKNKIKSKNINS